MSHQSWGPDAVRHGAGKWSTRTGEAHRHRGLGWCRENCLCGASGRYRLGFRLTRRLVLLLADHGLAQDGVEPALVATATALEPVQPSASSSGASPRSISLSGRSAMARSSAARSGEMGGRSAKVLRTIVIVFPLFCTSCPVGTDSRQTSPPPSVAFMPTPAPKHPRPSLKCPACHSLPGVRLTWISLPRWQRGIFPTGYDSDPSPVACMAGAGLRSSIQQTVFMMQQSWSLLLRRGGFRGYVRRAGRSDQTGCRWHPAPGTLRWPRLSLARGPIDSGTVRLY